MRRTRFLFLACLMVMGLFFAERAMGRARRAPTAPNEPAAKAAASERRIQVAILLDVSGSMSGLIAQTRTELWRLVSELSNARAGEQRPRIEMALYTYGRADSSEHGFIRRMTAFTSDMDLFSEALFAEQPAGGEEYCGEVIKDATSELDWSGNPDDLKIVFVAGNESFRQGNVSAEVAVKAAAEKGITVNTIYCGVEQAGVGDGWQEGARYASGKFMVIDHNQAVAEVVAPQDKELVRLNEQLGRSYVPYGVGGAAGLARRMAQDNNAASMSLSSAAVRAVSKADAFVCDGLDNDCNSAVQTELVNVASRDPSKLTALADADLPAELRGRTLEERKTWVEQKKQERAQLQTRIRRLGAERQKYVTTQRGAGQNTMGQAMIDAVHEQAGRANLSFADKK